jgi:hypothetical protein
MESIFITFRRGERTGVGPQGPATVRIGLNRTPNQYQGYLCIIDSRDLSFLARLLISCSS